MQQLVAFSGIDSIVDYSPYSADGYKCASSCYDLPQDEPKKEDRKSDIEFYFPKEARCPKNQICCKRREKPKTIEAKGAVKCADWGPGFECTTLDRCEPDTFAVKSDVINSENIKPSSQQGLYNI